MTEMWRKLRRLVKRTAILMLLPLVFSAELVATLLQRQFGLSYRKSVAISAFVVCSVLAAVRVSLMAGTPAAAAAVSLGLKSESPEPITVLFPKMKFEVEIHTTCVSAVQVLCQGVLLTLVAICILVFRVSVFFLQIPTFSTLLSAVLLALAIIEEN